MKAQSGTVNEKLERKPIKRDIKKQPGQRLSGYIGRSKATHGKTAPSPMMLHAAICKGVNMVTVDLLKADLDMNDGQLAEALGTSTPTLQRMRKGGKTLDAVESDRFYRYARIFSLAVEVFEDEANAKSWLHRPQFGLGGAVPLDLIKTEPGARTVENLLMRIEYGALA